ncbi:hypothetical protein DFAR_2500033 [Desulfarculales bacterium]
MVATPGRLDCRERRERYRKLSPQLECEGCQPPPRLEPGNLTAWEV